MLVPAPGSKSAVPLKAPVVYIFPEASISIEKPKIPPKDCAHKKLPEASIFCTKTSLLPPADVKLLVPAPGSKSTVPLKTPVVYTFPEASMLMELPVEVPSKDFAHKKLPDASIFCTKASPYPADVKLYVPAPGSKSTVPSKRPVVYTFPEASISIE